MALEAGHSSPGTAGATAWVVRYVRWREGCGLAAVTLERDQRALARLLAWMRAHRLRLPAVTAERIAQYIVQIRRRRWWCAGRWHPWSVSTMQGQIAALHVFFRYLVDEGVLLFDPMRGVHIRRDHALVGRGTFSEEEVAALFVTVDDETPGSLRDRALLALLYGAGLRLGELVALDLADYDPDAGVVFIRNGKGGKDRVLPLGPRTCRDVDTYLAMARPELVREPDEPALLVRAGGGRMSTQGARLRVRRLQVKAGLRPVRAPHALRHAFATHLLRSGAPLSALSRLLGHADLATTARYTHVDVEDLRRVLTRAHPRERGRRPR